MKWNKKKILFELDPEAICIDSTSRNNVYLTIPNEKYKLFPFQIVNIFAKYFFQFVHLVSRVPPELEFFFNYPSMTSFIGLQNAAATREEMRKWIRAVLLKERPESEPETVQENPAVPVNHQEATLQIGHSRGAIRQLSTPSSTAQPHFNWLTNVPLRMYWIVASFCFLLAIFSGLFYSGSSTGQKGSSLSLRSTPPRILQAPVKLYANIGNSAATVYMRIDQNGSIMEYHFRKGTLEQKEKYGSLVSRIRFQPGVSRGQRTTAWKIIQLPLKRK